MTAAPPPAAPAPAPPPGRTGRTEDGPRRPAPAAPAFALALDAAARRGDGRAGGLDLPADAADRAQSAAADPLAAGAGPAPSAASPIRFDPVAALSALVNPTSLAEAAPPDSFPTDPARPLTAAASALAAAALAAPATAPPVAPESARTSAPPDAQESFAGPAPARPDRAAAPIGPPAHQPPAADAAAAGPERPAPDSDGPTPAPRSSDPAAPRVDFAAVAAGPVVETHLPPAHLPQALHRLAAAAEAARPALEGQAAPTPSVGTGVEAPRPVAQVLRLTLEPERLGAVAVTLRLRGGALEARIAVERPETAALVERLRDELVRSFRRAGYEVGDIALAAPAEARLRDTWSPSHEPARDQTSPRDGQPGERRRDGGDDGRGERREHRPPPRERGAAFDARLR